MNRQLILVGGGGHCKSVIEICHQLGRTIKGILDLPSLVGSTVGGIEIIGTDDDIPRYVDTCDFVVTIGYVRSSTLRISLADRIADAGGRLATLISPHATVAHDASIGEGTVVLSGACVNAGARIGANVIINTLSAIEHDVTIGDHCHISTGAMVNGDCTVGARVFIGSNATIINGISIGSDIIVGAGSTVINDITEAGVYVGSPAHNIR